MTPQQALTDQFLKACPLDGQYERFTRPIDNGTRPKSTIDGQAYLHI